MPGSGFERAESAFEKNKLDIFQKQQPACGERSHNRSKRIAQDSMYQSKAVAAVYNNVCSLTTDTIHQFVVRNAAGLRLVGQS